MPSRRRIKSYTPNVTNPGGGSSVVGNLAIGPDFGEGAGSDGNTFTITPTIDLDAIAMEGNLSVTPTITMPELAMVGNLSVTPTITGTALGAPFWLAVEPTLGNASGALGTKPAGAVFGDLLLYAFHAVGTLSPRDIREDDNGENIQDWGAAFPQSSVGLASSRIYYKWVNGLENNPFVLGANLSETHLIRGARRDTATFEAGTSGFSNRFRSAHAAEFIATKNQPGLAGTDNYTIDFRLKTTGTNKWLILGENDVASGPLHSWTFGIDSNGRASFGPNTTGNHFTLTSVSTFNDGVEHTFRMTKDGSTWTLYVDGVSVDSEVDANGWWDRTGEPFFLKTLTGKSADVTTWDEIRISNVVRSDSTASPFTTDANTLILLHLDSVSDTYQTDDSSGNGRHAYIFGNPIDVIDTTTNASIADPIAPSVTTTIANTLVFYAVCHIHVISESHTPPANNTERTDFEDPNTGANVGSTSGTRIFAATGATGTATIDCTQVLGSNGISHRIAIAPGLLELT